MCVLDLGSSPGSWSKYVIEKKNCKNKVFSCDILPMKPIKGVKFFQGDLRNKKFIKLLIENLYTKKINLVISDMAPNITGHTYIDVSNSINLAKLALFVCQAILTKKGSFVVKLFQGEGFNEYLNMVRNLFIKVKIRKPYSSRTCSKELFIVAEGCIK